MEGKEGLNIKEDYINRCNNTGLNREIFLAIVFAIVASVFLHAGNTLLHIITMTLGILLAIVLGVLNASEGNLKSIIKHKI